jgi:outer membrane protein assembly factor BamA
MPLKNKIIFFLFIGWLSASGQKNFTLKTIVTDSVNKDLSFLKRDLIESKYYADTIHVLNQIESSINKLKNEGFLAVSMDSLIRDSSKFTAYLYSGEKYTWAIIRQGNLPAELLDGTGFRKKLYSGKPFRYDQITSLNKKILRNCENNGFPFATISLDSITIDDNQFSASLLLNKNRFIHIDSIIIKGNADVAPVYIYNYIGIKPGDIYKETQVRRISSRFKELPFVKEVKTSQVLFTDKEVKLFLYLENKKASQFDGVIGFLPDETNTGKLNLTGEVHLKLQNSLKRGEIIELNWRQLPGQSQDLKVRGLYPFLFNTPFGLDGSLAIFKKDSTYIDVIKNLGVQYALTGSNYIKAFINDKQSDLQSLQGLENITVLPPYADITTVSYGASIHYEILDYRLNPRKGFSIEATGSTGNREIRKNSDINPAVYDSINLRSVTYQGIIFLDYYFSLGGRHVINLGGNMAYINNPYLFTNELYRIGGLKSLRGFDEESIYASAYAFGKAEYRYLLEQNSFLFTFINMAWYENKSNDLYITDTPIGFGAGINFETKIGIMSVSYALGKQFDNPVLFKNGKIHFGIVNYF